MSGRTLSNTDTVQAGRMLEMLRRHGDPYALTRVIEYYLDQRTPLYGGDRQWGEIDVTNGTAYWEPEGVSGPTELPDGLYTIIRTKDTP